MDNIHSLFYSGKQQNPFGIGTWDSKGHKLKHSSSLPYYNNKTLPPTLADQYRKKTQYSNTSQYIKLPIIHSRPGSYHKNIKTSKSYKTISSSESSYQYDVNKNRKELSNYVKDINNSIAVKLQNDNFIAQQKLNNIKNNYNEIKTLLNNKIDKLEQDQQMQFDNLKYALEQGGSLKMMGAVKNANGGNNYDLKRAEEEDMIDATRKLPKLLEDKINIINNMKKKEKQDEKRLLSQVRKKVEEEIKKQKEKDEIRFKKEIDEIEQKRENIRRERRRLIEELQYNNNDDSESNNNTFYPNNPNPNIIQQPGIGMYPPQMMPQYPYHPSMYPPPPMNNNNSNNNNDSTSEFLKIFLLKKLFDDKPQVIQNPQPQIPQFIPTPYPQMQPQMPQQIQYQPPPYQQPISYPQPIIYQNSPPMNNNPNVIVQGKGQQYKDIIITKSETLNSDKGIPFIDPLEEYLEETKTKKRTRTKSKSKRTTSKVKTSKKSSRKKSTTKTKTKSHKKKDEDEEEDTHKPTPIKINKEKTKEKDKKSSKSKKTKSDKNGKQKDTKNKKKEKKKKKEEEEEFDEEEEEEDDEEGEEEEDDEEGEEVEDDEQKKGKKKK